MFKQDIKTVTNDLKMTRLSKMLTPEDLEMMKSVDQKEEACCKQCIAPVPLICWRNKIKYTLLQSRIEKPSVDDVRPPQDSEFYLADTWKALLNTYVENTGSYLTDHQWQLRYFEFAKTRQESSSNKFIKPLDTNLVFRASQNEEILTTNKSLSKDKIDQMKEQEKETGQSVLMLGQLFHEKILFIKKQLNFMEHPLRQIIEKFKNVFCKSNEMLLCKSAAEECKDDLTLSTH